MKQFFFFVGVLVFITGFSLPLSAQEKGWEFVTTQDSVKISKKEVSGTTVMAFRGETIANVHISKIVAVFIDEKERKHWVDRYHSHKTLSTSERAATYWIKFQLPFPISNRDYVLHTSIDVDEPNRVFMANIKSVKDTRKPEDDCCVRAETTRAFYRFEAVPGEEKTKMIVEVHTDPKGMLPNWLINRIQKDWPSKTLGNLIKQSIKRRVGHPGLLAWHE